MKKLNSILGKPLTQDDLDAADNLLKIWNSKKKELALTQVSAAKKLGITQPNIHKYLHGKLALNLKIVMAWAELLRVHPTEIRPDAESQLKAAYFNQTVKIVALLYSDGHSSIVPDLEVRIPTLTKGKIISVKIETKNFPGYFQGQLVLFDLEAPGSKDRHSVALHNNEYCIVEHRNNKWINVANNEVVDVEDQNTFMIVGTNFI